MAEYGASVLFLPVSLRDESGWTLLFSEAVQGFYGLIVIATTGMLILIYRSLAKDDTRPDTVQYMSHVCRLLLIDIGIKIVGTILGVIFWPPFASIGILIAAVFIAIMRRGNPEVERDDNERGRHQTR